MGHSRAEEPDIVVPLPAFFLVRTQEIQDAGDVVRHTLRLGAKGKDVGRRWFVPVFSSEELAGELANDVRKIDDKLRVFEIDNVKDWLTLLDALYANGDQFVAFDPRSHFVEHIAIDGLLGISRREGDSDSSSRSRDHDTRSSWLRRRPALGRSDPAQSGHGRTRPEIAGRS